MFFGFGCGLTFRGLLVDCILICGGLCRNTFRIRGLIRRLHVSRRLHLIRKRIERLRRNRPHTYDQSHEQG